MMRSRELLMPIKAGAIDGLSIGFKTMRGRVDPKARVRKLDQVVRPLQVDCGAGLLRSSRLRRPCRAEAR